MLVSQTTKQVWLHKPCHCNASGFFVFKVFHWIEIFGLCSVTAILSSEQVTWSGREVQFLNVKDGASGRLCSLKVVKF